jgi:ubiquinone/menaquinone biosynthesis C-methylase UbiE
VIVMSLSERAWQIITALSMTAGRGPLARAVADAAQLTPADRVIDIGCGPGVAVRFAARRGAAATGVDPDPAMLRLARWITALRRPASVSWLEGRAEKLPVPADQATVAWAISSAHHWEDLAAGIGEARRALAPAGRLVLAERLTEPGARGHAAHGLTRGQAEELARQLTAAGFGQVRLQSARAGHRPLIIVSGVKDPGA